MAFFHGELQLEGDSDRLPALVKVEMGSLTLSSGRTEIGTWKLYALKLLDLGDRVMLTADEETVALFLVEHSSFVGEVERFLEKPDEKRSRRRRREPKHPAFDKAKKEQGAPTAEPREPRQWRAAALHQEVVEESAPIVAEAKGIFQKVNPGPVLWGAVGAFVAAFFFAPDLLFGILIGIGLLAVVVGVPGYLDNTLAARYPNRLPPTRLLLLGVGAIVVAFLVVFIR